MPKTPPTLQSAIESYLTIVEEAHQPGTHRAYQLALRKFVKMLARRPYTLNAAACPVTVLEAQWVSDFARLIKDYAEASIAVWMTGLVDFYGYVTDELKAPVEMETVRRIVKRRRKKVKPTLPPFPRHEVEGVLDYVEDQARQPARADEARLRALRDRALLLMLADTGLRISEACGLKREQIDWQEGRAVARIKGGRESVVRFSERALAALKVYLQARALLDGSQGKALGSLPVFARHDRGAGYKIKPLQPTGVRKLLDEIAIALYGAWENDSGQRRPKQPITPHMFRHYFVTVVLRATGNLKVAQELARHQSITSTQRYAHIDDTDLDKQYHEVFNLTG